MLATEAIVVMLELQFASDLGFSKVLTEMDSKAVVDLSIVM